MRGAAVLLVLLGTGCPEDVPYPHPQDSGVDPGEGIDLHGRVVDFESCPIPPGCVSVEGMVVEVVGTATTSAATGREGAFLIRDAPADRRLTLAVRGDGRYARTISAEAVPASDDDVFDILLYVMPSGIGTLLAGIADERGVDLETSGGYVGQVVAHIEPEGDNPLCPDLDEGLCAVEDVEAAVRPGGYGVVAYVNALPSFVPDGPVVLPRGVATTSSGLFAVLPATPQDSEIDVDLVHPDMAVPSLTAIPVAPGAVSLGLHRAD